MEVILLNRSNAEAYRRNYGLEDFAERFELYEVGLVIEVCTGGFLRVPVLPLPLIAERKGETRQGRDQLIPIVFFRNLVRENIPL